MGKLLPLGLGANVIDLLRTGLERAERGELRGVAVVLLQKSGGPLCGFAHERQDGGIEVEGACHRLLTIVTNALEGGNE